MLDFLPPPHPGHDQPHWWPDHTLIPATDAACQAILDRAVACLILVRGGDPHDPGAVISTLVSLIADADDRLPGAVARARTRGYTWNRVAERLGTTISAARHRFAGQLRRPRQLDLLLACRPVSGLAGSVTGPSQIDRAGPDEGCGVRIV
jgi:hypothetical protein